MMFLPKYQFENTSRICIGFGVLDRSDEQVSVGIFLVWFSDTKDPVSDTTPIRDTPEHQGQPKNRALPTGIPRISILYCVHYVY